MMDASIEHDLRHRLVEESAEALLQGRFICEITLPEHFQLLSEEYGSAQAQRILSSLGRRLRRTEDGRAYYAALTHLRGDDRKASVQRQFAKVINQLEPLMKWLSLVMSALQQSQSVEPGDLIRVSELQTVIETTPALSEELDGLTRVGLFRTQRDNDGDRLLFVINKLVEEGYLVASGGRSRLFVATGKWSYLYEVIDFVAQHEDLGEEERTETQEGLPL